jgi:hypothetical protein
MDKKINKIIETYVTTYKQEIKNKAVSLGFAEQDKIDLIEYVMEYERLVLKKEEFIKQKRTKNAISNVNRCMAIISSGVNAPANEKKELRTVRDARKGNPLGLVNQILYRKPRCTL